MDFQTFCQLILRLEFVEEQFQLPWSDQLRARYRGVGALSKVRTKLLEVTVEEWAKEHVRILDSLSEDELVALLSLLFSDERKDMVYGLQIRSLTTKLIAGFTEWFGWSKVDTKDFMDWQRPGNGSLGDCIEKVMRRRRGRRPEVAPKSPMTVLQVYLALEKIASQCRYSDPAIKDKYVTSAKTTKEALRDIFKHLRPWQARIFVSLLLKDLAPVELNHWTVLYQIHPLLSSVYKVRKTFRAAAKFLQNPEIQFIGRGLPSQLYKANAYLSMKPEHNTPVDRTYSAHGSSPQAIIDQAKGRRMFLERKYDGEYCQIHIDLSKSGDESFVIFSKSGKRSTQDKVVVHNAIKRSLRFGDPEWKEQDRQFKASLMIECELLVFHQDTKEPMPFHYIRKHLTRSGSRIGIQNYSPPHAHEVPGIVFFDVIQVDDLNVQREPLWRRREWLESLVSTTKGLAEVSEYRLLDFSSQDIGVQLRDAFAEAAANRWEGWVMKPVNVSRFGFGGLGAAQRSKCAKLKLGYFETVADKATMAVVGASYNPQVALRKNMKGLRWTHLHIATLDNKSEVLLHRRKPRYLIRDAINTGLGTDQWLRVLELAKFKECKIPEDDMAQARDKRDLTTEDFDIIHDAPNETLNLQILFREPLVLDVKGIGFQRPSGCRHLMLRFPSFARITGKFKVETSRLDFISTEELTRLAESGMYIPEGADISKERAIWRQKLATGGFFARNDDHGWNNDDYQSDCDGYETGSDLGERELPPPREELPSIHKVKEAAERKQEQSAHSGPTTVREDTVERQLDDGEKEPHGEAGTLEEASKHKSNPKPKPGRKALEDVTNERRGQGSSHSKSTESHAKEGDIISKDKPATPQDRSSQLSSIASQNTSRVESQTRSEYEEAERERLEMEPKKSRAPAVSPLGLDRIQAILNSSRDKTNQAKLFQAKQILESVVQEPQLPPLRESKHSSPEQPLPASSPSPTKSKHSHSSSPPQGKKLMTIDEYYYQFVNSMRPPQAYSPLRNVINVNDKERGSSSKTPKNHSEQPKQQDHQDKDSSSISDDSSTESARSVNSTELREYNERIAARMKRRQERKERKQREQQRRELKEQKQREHEQRSQEQKQQSKSRRDAQSHISVSSTATTETPPSINSRERKIYEKTKDQMLQNDGRKQREPKPPQDTQAGHSDSSTESRASMNSGERRKYEEWKQEWKRRQQEKRKREDMGQRDQEKQQAQDPQLDLEASFGESPRSLNSKEMREHNLHVAKRMEKEQEARRKEKQKGNPDAKNSRKRPEPSAPRDPAELDPKKKHKTIFTNIHPTLPPKKQPPVRDPNRTVRFSSSSSSAHSPLRLPTSSAPLAADPSSTLPSSPPPTGPNPAPAPPSSAPAPSSLPPPQDFTHSIIVRAPGVPDSALSYLRLHRATFDSTDELHIALLERHRDGAARQIHFLIPDGETPLGSSAGSADARSADPRSADARSADARSDASTVSGATRDSVSARTGPWLRHQVRVLNEMPLRRGDGRWVRGVWGLLGVEIFVWRVGLLGWWARDKRRMIRVGDEEGRERVWEWVRGNERRGGWEREVRRWFVGRVRRVEWSGEVGGGEEGEGEGEEGREQRERDERLEKGKWRMLWA